MQGGMQHAWHGTSGRARVLLACTASAREVLERALFGWAEWTSVYTLDDALRHLDDPPDLVVCTLRFGESRMLELAAEVARRGIAFVCCRIGESELPARSLEAAMIAARNLGARDFVDFAKLRGEYGVERALVRFRAAILATAA